jgi:3-hydroxyisobutyrate dehydrogenase-like beta-hydroxyacid dehydrogenase
MTTIGLLHPGEMGSAVGGAARTAGALVLWASGGRSAATQKRAQDDGLQDVNTVERLIAESQVILSICPPASAVDVAQEVASYGFGGTYVDGNAIAPDTTRDVGAIIAAAGATYVDGGIIGPPPRRPGVARLYLSGYAAEKVAALFAGSLLEAIVVAGPIGAASALKMAYAGWTKGQSALLLAIRALAVREGVDEALIAEWTKSQPDLLARSENALGTARKAWRFVGEMEEIAKTFAAANLPDGFHLASAEIYRRLEEWKDTPTAPSLDAVTKALAP